MIFKLKFVCLIMFSFFLFNCNNEENKKVLYETPIEGDSSPVQEAPKVAATTEITFEETEFDFGTLEDGEKKNHTFKFKNTGNAPLIISDTRADCGCTTPSFTKDPVMPGQEGKIEVEYNSAGRGGQTVSKTVTVIANTDPSDTKLTIKAVVKAKISGAPFKDK
jgi:hypothetical protein